ncbi:SurA N-terminal domain-containing protein [Roseivivax isoporae]|uniref:Uncharacterized protein n=1 Tax=Roseivivax isoporae LMG 25204 TaxID=1449351 RepID=X7FG61_9RHOB|nr:SurA N-terminal domain-containing protein [Roseivivax isoporae]ETX31016.1 hypothetical protein RISW2_00120 [Roseivivax isoporae LMG 25204]
MRFATRLTTSAAAAAIALTSAAFAQSQDGAAEAPDTRQNQDTTASSQGAPGAEGQIDPEARIASVDDADITQADVMAMIQAMPERMRQQPAETLIPMAVEQLIMHELVLAAAAEAGLSEDEEVQAAVEEDARMREEDAMVRVFLQRELDGAVTDEAVRSTYEEIKANADAEIPPLEDVRPQIENQLRQEAYGQLQSELQEGTRIVFYGPDGEPRAAGTDPANAGSKQETTDGDTADR